MTVAELIQVLQQLPPDAPVALRSVDPDQRVRWQDIEAVEPRSYDGAAPVVLIR